MTFDDLLAQVLALLQREQRLSYRALQRRFALEEADLEALKDELIYAKRLAIDEDNRVLVWAGEVGTAQYLRVRGTDGKRSAVGLMGASVDPAGPAIDVVGDADPWQDLWFYANPIWVVPRP